MNDFKLGDIIGYNSSDEGYIYGIVIDITDNELVSEYLGDLCEYFWVPKDEADYIEPIYIDTKTAKKFARYEITAMDIIGDAVPPARVRTKEIYTLSIEDVIATLKKANGMPIEQFRSEWFTPIWETLSFSFSFGDSTTCDSGDSGYHYLPSDDFFVWDAIDRVDNYLYDKKNDYSDIIKDLYTHKDDLELPIPQRKYNEDIKSNYIRSFDENNMLEKATEKELALFIQYVDELCEKNNKAALYAKAYGSYGGNRAFPCDWVVSRDCLLRLLEIDENPFIANTLGYIYYYGRCTNGEPEYEKAFKYFSIGAAGYVYESRYKLSDMFHHGYGVPKNNKVAASIIWELYNKNIKYIYQGIFDTKFADIALRAGNIFRDGINCKSSPDDAYYYYLQADFAIRMRMLESNHYGDCKVADGISKAITEILPQTAFVKQKKTVRSPSIERITSFCHEEHRPLKMKIRKLKNGEYSLNFSIVKRDDEKYQPKLFFTVPSAHFCGMINSITVTTVNCTKIRIWDKVLDDNTATIVFDSAWCDGLYFNGILVADVDCKEYIVKIPFKEDLSKHHFVSVAFQPGGYTYDYFCEIPDVSVGDKVVVETTQGEVEVEVVRVFDKTSSETALPISKYKSIKRKA